MKDKTLIVLVAVALALLWGQVAPGIVSAFVGGFVIGIVASIVADTVAQ